MVKKKEQNVEVNKVTQEEGTILVTRTTVVSGKEILEERSQEVTKIKVRPFLCQPAYVSIKMGETIPLVQQYAGRRIDVNISHPCYKEEIPEILRDAAGVVNNFLEEEVLKIENAAMPRKKKTVKKTNKKTAVKKEVKPVEEEKDDLDDLLFDNTEKAVSASGNMEIEEDDDLADII